MTGLVGAAGGLGGFLVPSVLGLVKQETGNFGIGLLSVAIAMLGGAANLLWLKNVWRRTWPRMAAQRAGLLPQEAEEDVRAYAANV